MLSPQASEWEAPIVAVIIEELDQLRYLVADESGSTERGDIHAQVDRICGLTDLADNDAIPFAESTRLQIRKLNEMAMGLIRTTLNFTPPSDGRVESIEREAAQGLYLVEAGAQVLILGCTELPLILAHCDSYDLGGKICALVDPTTILAQRCVSLAHSRELAGARSVASVQ